MLRCLLSTKKRLHPSLRSPLQVYARIARPDGIISFAAPKTPNELLNDWAGDLSALLNHLEGACHLIHKENMLHKVS